MPAPLWPQLYPLQSFTSWVAEDAEPFQPAVPEKLVHCLWFDPRWRPDTLQTLDGRPVTVHSPGRWNRQAGPDFVQATLTLDDGERQQGDVEIHRTASGWTAHQHHRDARYNGVILHVFLWNDRRATEVSRADGQAVPQVALADWLPRPPATYYADIVLDDYPQKHIPFPGRCYETLRHLDLAAVKAFLDRAGDARLQQRVYRWAGRSTEVDFDQVMYEAVLRSLGSTGHRQHFQELTRLVSWRELQQCLAAVPTAKRGVAAEALLLGLTGILPLQAADMASPDGATQRYVSTLRGHWRRAPRAIRQRAWRQVNWRQPHVRPANTPERRLAGMAQLLGQYQETSLLAASVALCRTADTKANAAALRKLCQALTQLLDVPTASYWTSRAHLGGSKGRAQRLIGAGRALTIVVDAILPVLLLYAQHQADPDLQAQILACYHAAPRLPDNYLLRYMARRLLGDDLSLLALLTGARQQQGVLQVFADFCSHDEGNCQGCDFPLAPTASHGELG